MVKIYKKTGVKCPICGTELQLVEETYYNDFDGDLLKDVEHYFECVNGCNSEIVDTVLLENRDKHIERIITERLEVS